MALNPNHPLPQNTDDTGQRRASQRIAAMPATPNYNPKLPPLELETRVAGYTPPRLARPSELNKTVDASVSAAALAAAPKPNHCEDTNAPNLNKRLVWAHMMDRGTLKTYVLRYSHDLRCGYELNVDSFMNVVQLEPNAHSDIDHRRYLRCPVKEDMDKLFEIVEHNRALPWNSPERIDVRKVFPGGKGHKYLVEYVPLKGRRTMDEPIYDDDGKIVGVRSGDAPRKAFWTHSTPDYNGGRFIGDLQMLDCDGELESVGFSQEQLGWYTEILDSANDFGWFDPLDETHEWPYLVAKGVVKKDDQKTKAHLKGQGVDGKILPRSCIKQQKSGRDFSYLDEMLDPGIETPRAPSRTYRSGLIKKPRKTTTDVKRLPVRKSNINSTPSSPVDIPLTPRTRNAKKKAVVTAQNFPSGGGRTPTSDSTPTPSRSTFGVKYKASATSNLSAATTRTPETTTRVPTSKALSPGARVPKRGRESDVVDVRTVKKGKIAEKGAGSPPVPARAPSIAKSSASSTKPSAPAVPENLRKSVLSNNATLSSVRTTAALPKRTATSKASGLPQSKVSQPAPARILAQAVKPTPKPAQKAAPVRRWRRRGRCSRTRQPRRPFASHPRLFSPSQAIQHCPIQVSHRPRGYPSRRRPGAPRSLRL